MSWHVKRFLAMFILSWLAGAGLVTLHFSQYAVEDFTVPDLIPVFSILAVLGLLLSVAVSMPVLLLLRRRVTGVTAIPLLPLVNALVVTSLVAAVAGWRAFASHNLPVSEAVTFTAAFLAMSWTFGLVFMGFSKEGRARKWGLTLSGLAAGSVFLLSLVLPLVEESIQASERNGTVARAATLSTPRSAHTATLLADGRVLLIGGMVSVRGDEVPTATTELYDPTTGATTLGGRMSVARAGHTATLLGNGDMLVTGGGDEKGSLASCELYRAGTGDFIPVGAMGVPRERHTATLLPDGRVLVTGGTVARPDDMADLYDPATRAFLPTARMRARRAAHTATLLRDGRVLIAGGAESLTSVLRTMEVYDPIRNTFTDAAPMQVSRYKHSAVPMDDGKVLIVGGSDNRDWGGRRNSVEVYDAERDRCGFVSAMQRARFKLASAVALDANGSVVVAGSGRRVEVYDRAGRFRVSAGDVEDEWFYATATTLPDGRVFIAGGYNSSMVVSNLSWVYQPAARPGNAAGRAVALSTLGRLTKR